MAKERADLGFGDALDEFNPEEWTPPKASASNDKPAAKRPSRAATNQAAAAAGFKSREPKPTPKTGPVRGPRSAVAAPAATRSSI